MTPLPNGMSQPPHEIDIRPEIVRVRDMLELTEAQRLAYKYCPWCKFCGENDKETCPDCGCSPVLSTAGLAVCCGLLQHQDTCMKCGYEFGPTRAAVKKSLDEFAKGLVEQKAIATSDAEVEQDWTHRLNMDAPVNKMIFAEIDRRIENAREVERARYQEAVVALRAITDAQLKTMTARIDHMSIQLDRVAVKLASMSKQAEPAYLAENKARYPGTVFAQLQSIDDLKRGDIVKGKSSGLSYVVDGGVAGGALAMRSVLINNPEEWEVLR